jgi:hypothetical protein
MKPVTGQYSASIPVITPKAPAKFYSAFHKNVSLRYHCKIPVKRPIGGKEKISVNEVTNCKNCKNCKNIGRGVLRDIIKGTYPEILRKIIKSSVLTRLHFEGEKYIV